jgi:hypothetical protein
MEFTEETTIKDALAVLSRGCDKQDVGAVCAPSQCFLHVEPFRSCPDCDVKAQERTHGENVVNLHWTCHAKDNNPHGYEETVQVRRALFCLVTSFYLTTFVVSPWGFGLDCEVCHRREAILCHYSGGNNVLC